MSVDEVFELFVKQYRANDPDFRFDDPAVREKIVTLISVSASLLLIAPPGIADEFMERCSKIAKELVPQDVQDRIKQA